jgi:hypothetical protein
VKRIIETVLAVALLAGVAFAAQMFTSRVPARTSASDVTSLAATLKTDGLRLPEPISIVLSSLILLGGTTMLRRHRMNRGA